MITANDVRHTLLASLYPDEELEGTSTPIDAILVRSVRLYLGFKPKALESQREKVIEFINELPITFRSDLPNGGNGASFLDLCVDKNNNIWAAHGDVDNLIALAIGLNLGEFCMPRDMWSILPGGMPYVRFYIGEN